MLFIIISTYFRIINNCALGAFIQYQNDDLMKAFYNISWYLMRIREQQAILLCIENAQKTEGIKIKLFGHLDFVLGMRVTTTVYTYSMLFIENII